MVLNCILGAPRPLYSVAGENIMAEKKERFDIQQSVTNQIIDRIEKGGLPPWFCPWTKAGEPAMPYNFESNRKYSGVNVILLWMRAMDQGFTSNGWLTFNQAKKLGGTVRKGEKATRLIFYKPIEIDREDEDDEDGSGKVVLNYRKVFRVFNVEQIDGLSIDQVDNEKQDFGCVHAADAIESIWGKYSEVTKVKMLSGGDWAYYSPSKDYIRLPNTFHDAESYAATFAHEMIHSTGHPSRLDRFDQGIKSFESKKKSYAFEELVAEIGAAFVCAELGIDSSIEHHACYLDHWLDNFKNDKSFLFKAAAASARAHELLMKPSSLVTRKKGPSLATGTFSQHGAPQPRNSALVGSSM